MQQMMLALFHFRHILNMLLQLTLPLPEKTIFKKSSLNRVNYFPANIQVNDA